MTVGDFDDDDDDDDDHMSVDSDSSDMSESSCDTVEFLFRRTCDYGSYIYKCFEDPNINWDASPPLISDTSESQCINEFHFQKEEHLQIVLKKLWNLMQPHLEGNYDLIRVQNHYTMPFETCFMFLLCRLCVPRRIQSDMERFFGIRKSKISAAMITFVDALYEVALPFLSNPAIFQHHFPLYSKLILD
jgi:hypothetical protein